jgi:pyruvate/2-oxoglutarate dehydrogenase complex dihydrolipoamide acyltransferase (E2) component
MNDVSLQLPKLTMAALEATFVEWLVHDGQHVVEGQPLYVVETDKVETEVSAPVTGILRHRGAESGSTYPIGTQVAIIEVTGSQAGSAGA